MRSIGFLSPRLFRPLLSSGALSMPTIFAAGSLSRVPLSIKLGAPLIAAGSLFTAAKPQVWKRVDVAQLKLGGKKVVIVGGTGGLGQALARVLASRGAEVTVVGQTFRDSDVSGIKFVRADLSSMKEATQVADRLPFESADLVVFTTGIFAAPQRQVTAEGIERDMAISYLSRLAIIRQAATRIGTQRSSIASSTSSGNGKGKSNSNDHESASNSNTSTLTPHGQARPRVFIMGYPGNGEAGVVGDLNAEQSYSSMKVHMNTVAGNEILVHDGVHRYPHVDFYGLNPGIIKTNIRNNLFGEGVVGKLMESLIGIVTPTPEEYAKTTVPLLVAPDLEHNGALFDKKGNPLSPSAGLSDRGHVTAFLNQSEALLARALATSTSTSSRTSTHVSNLDKPVATPPTR